jgi:8-oxo-dGTP pyrophosphatase MutT (NUDIX family)
MVIPLRNSVKVLLFNENNELLLMCADDPKTTSADKTYHGRFWFCTGGQIHPGESIQDAALRETYEETGIPGERIELGPVVWFGEFTMILHGVLTRLKQTFIVAKTMQRTAFLTDPDQWEKNFVQNLAWFSLEKIKTSNETIFPVLLPNYLPDILVGNYPMEPFEIDLAKQPEKKCCPK